MKLVARSRGAWVEVRMAGGGVSLKRQCGRRGLLWLRQLSPASHVKRRHQPWRDIDDTQKSFAPRPIFLLLAKATCEIAFVAPIRRFVRSRKETFRLVFWRNGRQSCLRLLGWVRDLILMALFGKHRSITRFLVFATALAEKLRNESGRFVGNLVRWNGQMPIRMNSCPAPTS